MIDRRRVLAAALALAAPAALAAPETPRDIVARIYKLSAGPKGDYSGSSAFFDGRFRKSAFSKALLSAVLAMEARSKKSGEPGLDFDPVTDSQDPSVRDLAIAAESESVATASFDVAGPGTRHTIRYVFAREGGGWKLDNMTSNYQGGNWDLRKLLEPD